MNPYKPKKVNISDLIQTNEKRVQERENVKNMFLEKCHVRIASYNNFGREDVLFEIPPFVIGLPPYDKKDIMEYLVASLSEDCFLVKPIQNATTHSIYISWRKKDVEKIKEARGGLMLLQKKGFFENLPVNKALFEKSAGKNVHL